MLVTGSDYFSHGVHEPEFATGNGFHEIQHYYMVPYTNKISEWTYVDVLNISTAKTIQAAGGGWVFLTMKTSRVFQKKNGVLVF